MKCIYCGGRTAVIDKRSIRRRRKCLKCNKRFSTREVIFEKESVPKEAKVTKVKIVKVKVSKVKDIKKVPLSPEKQRLIELFRGNK